MKYNNWEDEFIFLMFDQLDSTNNEAIKIGKQNLPNNFIIYTPNQTQGHGKHGRKWESSNKDLTFSLLLNQKISPDVASQLVFVTGVAMALAIESCIINSEVKVISKQSVTNINNKPDIKLKWPNDVIIKDKKCAGILIESNLSYSENLTDFIVIGIGVNVKSTSFQQFNFPATSLLENSINVEPTELLDKFMQNFSKCYNEWNKSGFTNIKNLWMQYAYKLNSKVEVNKNDGIMTGIFKEIDDNGLLVLVDEKHLETKVSTGDVFFR